MNPTIIQRKKLHDKLWDIVQPNSTQIEQELDAQKHTYYKECAYRFPVDAYITPGLNMLCKSVKERLHVEKDVAFFVDDCDIISARCIVSGNKKYPSIVTLTSGAVNRLNDKELAFLIGHELGHLIMDDGIMQYFWGECYSKNNVPQELVHKKHVLALLSEMEADRYGYLACESLDAYVSLQYKLIGGLEIEKHGVTVSTFLWANRRRLQLFMDGGWLGNDHPANALRIEAVHIFATSKSASELRNRMQPIIDSILRCED